MTLYVSQKYFSEPKDFTNQFFPINVDLTAREVTEYLLAVHSRRIIITAYILYKDNIGYCTVYKMNCDDGTEFMTIYQVYSGIQIING